MEDIPKINLPFFDFICTFANIFMSNLQYTNKHKEIIKFPTPITINAQSSLDIDYGYYSDGSHNFYGDTSKFQIIGYIVK